MPKLYNSCYAHYMYTSSVFRLLITVLLQH